MKKQILGIDIGGVIIDRINDNTDTSFFGENYLNTTAVPDAFTVISELEKRYNNNLVIVSKCGKRTEEKTRAWLEYQNFFERTGVRKDALYFCRERYQKDGICSELGVTGFIDDRLEVLGYLQTVSRKYLFQPNEREINRFKHLLTQVIRVETWQGILEHERSVI